MRVKDQVMARKKNGPRAKDKDSSKDVQGPGEGTTKHVILEGQKVKEHSTSGFEQPMLDYMIWDSV